MKLRKGDRVQVRSGKDRGREGEILRVFPKENKVLVDQVNVAKKHQRAQRATMQAGIIDKDMPLPASNVSIICPACKRPRRIGYRFEGGVKVRICSSCKGEI